MKRLIHWFRRLVRLEPTPITLVGPEFRRSELIIGRYPDHPDSVCVITRVDQSVHELFIDPTEARKTAKLLHRAAYFVDENFPIVPGGKRE